MRPTVSLRLTDINPCGIACQFPKMQGLKEEKVKLYIKSIKQQTDVSLVRR